MFRLVKGHLPIPDKLYVNNFLGMITTSCDSHGVIFGHRYGVGYSLVVTMGDLEAVDVLCNGTLFAIYGLICYTQVVGVTFEAFLF